MEQYVMTTGTIRMLLLSVHNLDSLLMVRLFDYSSVNSRNDWARLNR